MNRVSATIFDMMADVGAQVASGRLSVDDAARMVAAAMLEVGDARTLEERINVAKALTAASQLYTAASNAILADVELELDVETKH